MDPSQVMVDTKSGGGSVASRSAIGVPAGSAVGVGDAGAAVGAGADGVGVGWAEGAVSSVADADGLATVPAAQPANAIVIATVKAIA